MEAPHSELFNRIVEVENLKQFGLIEAYEFYASCADEFSNRTACQHSEPVDTSQIAKCRDRSIHTCQNLYSCLMYTGDSVTTGVHDYN